MAGYERSEFEVSTRVVFWVDDFHTNLVPIAIITNARLNTEHAE